MSKNLANKGVQAYGAYFGSGVALFCIIAGIILIYVGSTNMDNEQDPNYEKAVLNKIKSTIFCTTGASAAYCKNKHKRHKNIYSHTQCANHTAESPYTYVTRFVGPSTKTLDRHKETKECVEPPLTSEQSTVLLVVGIALLVLAILIIACIRSESCRRAMGGFFMLRSIFGSNNNY